MKKTIKEIAKITGVSPATVSKVIHNYSDVGKETKAKVMKAMEELGYQPVSSGKSSRKPDMVAVIFAGKVSADFNHPFFVNVINVFGQEMGSLGYDLLFLANDKFKTGERNFLADCRAAQVKGCIIIGGEDVQQNVYDLDQSDLPCIGVDIVLEGNKSGYLMTDNFKLAKQVVEYLYLLGHREIAYIGGLHSSIVGKERTQGFIQAMNEYGLAIKENTVVHGNYKLQSGYELTKRLLERKSLPKAVFAASDLMAYGAIKAIHESGYRVPEDVSVIGCDDIESSQYFSPALTTVRQNIDKIGRLSANMLADLIQGTAVSCSIRVDPELIVRDSCGHVSDINKGINPIQKKEVI